MKLRTPRMRAVPMTAENRRHLELHFYEHLDCLIHEPSEGAHNRLTRFIAIVDYAMALQRIPVFATDLNRARTALDRIFERYADTGVVAADKADVAHLRAAAPAIDAAICSMRFDTFEIARERANAIARAQGVTIN